MSWLYIAIKELFRKVGNLSAVLFPPVVCLLVDELCNSFYSGRMSRLFSSCGMNLCAQKSVTLYNPHRIEIGNNVQLHKYSILAVHSNSAKLRIGNSVVIGEYCHVTCASMINIGDGVLFGKKILVTDNSHGQVDSESLIIPPNERNIVACGQVVIGKNVWLGDNVVILPGVTIGEGSVIGASSVVTKSLPSYSVCVGNPARVVKKIK